jgi:CubicO group peptidase (beta-lactamase class C family)
VRSISKSVTSALVGIAFGDRADAALDRPLLDFFPEDTDLASPARRAIHLRHALTMSAGLQWEEDNPFADARNDAFGLEHSTDPVRFVLGRAVVAAPGTRFTYSAGLAQLLSAVLQRETGRPLRVYAREALFEPLGITDWEWIGNYAGGGPDAAAGLRLRARDLAKFGSLYLHDGRWNGRQVIPAAWVRASTRRQVTPVERGTLPPGREFGFLWSVDRLPTAAGPLEVHSALGNGGQCVFVLPALRTVVTLLAGRYDAAGPDWSRRLLLERIVPAVVTGARATGGQ